MVAARDIAEATKKAAKKVVPAANPEYLDAAVDATLAKEDEYQDQEDEWDDVAPQMVGFQEQSEARGILSDMHAEKARGLASRTALTTDDQASAMMELRIMHQHYPKFGFDEVVAWLEAYRISIGRKGRSEDVEILRGNVPLQQPGNDLNRPRTW